jgi:Ca-activated chloride channel family protein
MKRIRYSKYVPDLAGEMSMEDLLSALSDYLLQSGFQNYMYDEFGDSEQTLDDLRRAIEQALLDSDLLDEQMRQRLQQMQMEGTLDELIDQLIQRMEQEDYISIDQPHDPSRQSNVGGQLGEAQQRVMF